MPYKDPEKRRERNRAYQKKHYEQNKQYYIDKASERRKLLSETLRELKGSTPCADCGVSYPYYVMDLDHLPGEEKVDHPSRIPNRGSIRMLEEEIGKCDIVCANCHRVRTHNRSTAG